MNACLEDTASWHSAFAVSTSGSASAAFAFAAAVQLANSSFLSVAVIASDTSFSIDPAEIAAGLVGFVVRLRTFVVAASVAGAFAAFEESIVSLAVEAVRFSLA